MDISVAARNSPLSKAQVKEVLEAIQSYHPFVNFSLSCVDSTGDKDLTTSLRTLGKTDFFTREVDELVLEGRCRIAIHSAKDLPEPIPTGLKLIALTAGLDPSDSLVLKPGKQLQSLPQGSVIATSSERREAAVRSLRSDLTFTDLRGPIHKRLQLLEEGRAAGIVIAEAAILRLRLLHLNRIRLPGSTAPLQGQLALIAQESDHEMRALFQPLDARRRKKSLYLGPDYPLKRFTDRFIVHTPLIKIEPLYSEEIDKILSNWSFFTHLIFTSKNGVKSLVERLYQMEIPLETLKQKICFCVGKATAEQLSAYGCPSYTADLEQAEGVAELLAQKLDKDATILWIHSKLSRPLIGNFLHSKGFSYTALPLYDTVALENPEPIDYQELNEIIFSSPSTVHAFFRYQKNIPEHLTLTTIGSITSQALAEYGNFRENKLKLQAKEIAYG